MTLDKWKVLSSKNLIEKAFFKLRVDKCLLPDNRIMPSYYTFEFADWVNVVPITKEGKVLLIKQYRHAGGEVYFEIPGGTTHPGQNEDPMLAAKRELLEETGFHAKNWIYKGYHMPNPALQNNKMHTYLALNCEYLQPPQFDEFEAIEIQMFSKQKVLDMLMSGKIQHSLIAASLIRCYAELLNESQ